MSTLSLSRIRQLTDINIFAARSALLRNCHGLAHGHLRTAPRYVFPPQKLAMTFTVSTQHKRSEVKTPDSGKTSEEDQGEGKTSTLTNASGEGQGQKEASGEESHIANIRKILGSRRQFATDPPLPGNTPLPLFGQPRLEDKAILQEGVVAEKVDVDDFSPPTTCCMTGCHTCVWIEYVDRLSKHYSDPDLGKDKIRQEVNSIEDANIRAVLIMELKFRGLW